MLGIQTTFFGFQEFRVLFVTTSEKRVLMIEVNRRFNNSKDSELFLFTYKSSLCAAKRCFETRMDKRPGDNEVILRRALLTNSES